MQQTPPARQVLAPHEEMVAVSQLQPHGKQPLQVPSNLTLSAAQIPYRDMLPPCTGGNDRVRLCAGIRCSADVVLTFCRSRCCCCRLATSSSQLSQTAVTRRC